MTTLYLDPEVTVEPLYDRFYASTQLLSPSTSAMLVVNSHLRMLESYVANPHIHQSAVRSKHLRGGPFVDIDTQRMPAVRALLEETRARSRYQSEFVHALQVLAQKLEAEAKGLPLAPLYGQLPEVLTGVVELTYDLFDRPSFRLLESLLYRSPLYRRDAQSCCMKRFRSDSRPAGASTPRLPDANAVELAMPFSERELDWLFETERRGASFEAFVDRLKVSGEPARCYLKSLLRETPRVNAPRYQGEGVRLRYLGHAALLVETARVCFLVDPLIACRSASAGEVDRFTLQDLPECIDYVFLSHNHIDHVNLETLLRLRQRVSEVVVPRGGGSSLVDPSLRLALEHAGFGRVRELGEFESVDLPGGRVTGVPFFGEHGDHDIRTKLAHHIELEGQKLLCVTDSANLSPDLYARVHDVLGGVDRLFVGMECEGGPQSWLYGPMSLKKIDYAADQARRLSGSNCEQALDIVKRFSPRSAYVYAMASEPWLRFISSVEYVQTSLPILEAKRFVATCREMGLESESLYAKAEFVWNG